MTDLLIIGGGAAGLMAAGAACARGLTTAVVEHNPKGPGQKLLITGKGRCNVTNDCDVREFLNYVRHNPRFLYSALYAFSPASAMELFESLGVPLKTERGRRVFPQSDRAADVLAALRSYAADAKFVHGSAKELLIEDGRCVGVRTSDGKTHRAAHVLVTTGVTYDVTGSQLDVGSSDNSFTYELNEGTLAENYIIETEEGKLTVTSPEQHIVITANSAEKTYDGTPLTDDGFTYTDFVLAEGDVLEAVVEGSQTDAGSSVNVIKSYRVMRGDEDVTANYIFDDSVDGTLTVTKRKVTLTSGTACKIYDGKYLTCNKVEVGGDGFVEGEGATYDVTGKRKDIGWSYNDFTYKLNDNTKADNYEITVERGFLYVKDQAEKPKTGDSSDLLLLLALMSMSGAGAAGTVYLYRRKREEQE